MTNFVEPTFERLLDWVEGRLSPAEAQLVEQQVACAGAAVQTQVQWLRAFVKLGDQIIFTAPPPSVRAHLIQQFHEYAQTRRQPRFFQRLVAALTFDNARQPAALGVRAGRNDFARQFVFSTHVADVALNVQPRLHEPKLDLIGQILPRDEDLILDAFAIQLLRDEREVAITMADELGEFMLEGLDPSSYQVLLSTDDLEIDLSIVDLTS
jgi:hypothetical protein